MKVLSKYLLKDCFVSLSAKFSAHIFHWLRLDVHDQEFLHLACSDLLNSSVKALCDIKRTRSTGLQMYMDSGLGTTTDCLISSCLLVTVKTVASLSCMAPPNFQCQWKALNCHFLKTFNRHTFYYLPTTP